MIERLDGKPLSGYGLKSMQWFYNPSGTWTVAIPANRDRVSTIVQNVGTDVVYVRPAPLTDLGYGSGNALALYPRDSLQIDKNFPWLESIETMELVAGGTLNIVEIYDGVSR